eukprot:scaffold193320_cov69-Cyclotella_meneghiniana.AAC.2
MRFEEEGILGFFQFVASTAIHALTGSFSSEGDRTENKLAVVQFTNGLADFILAMFDMDHQRDGMAPTEEADDLPVESSTEPDVYLKHDLHVESPTEPEMYFAESSSLTDDLPLDSPTEPEMYFAEPLSLHDDEEKSRENATLATNPQQIVSESVTSLSQKENQRNNNSCLVVLLSKGVADYNQAAAQKASLSHLDDFRLPYHIVDGMDISQVDRRNELFSVSGIRGNYPQIFSCENNNYGYLGGYDWLEDQSIDQLIKLCGGYQKPLSTSGKTIDCESGNISSNSKYKGCLTVLISNGVADYKQRSNQQSALQLLADWSLPYTTIDGMDISQVDRRNELFSVSGIRGNYPQIFSCENNNYRYLGGYDWLEDQSIDQLIKLCGG